MYIAALGFSVLCFLGVGIYFWRSPAFSVFHPLTFYSAFHGLLFVVRPILAYAYGYQRMYYAYGFTPSDTDKLTVILASNLGFLAFSFFCLRTGGVAMQFRNSLAVQEERRRLSQIFVWVIVICGPLAAYSLMRTYSATNSVYDGLTLDKATGIAINTKSIGYLADMQLMAVSMCSLLIWLGRFRPLSFLPVAAFVLLRAGTGGRGPFVAALVSAGLFYLYEKRIRYPGLRVILGIVLLGSMFAFVGADRGAAVRNVIGFGVEDSFEARAQSDEGPLEGMDFANMEFFEYLVYVIPQRSGTYDYFLDNFQVFTEPVPRILWTGKPIGEPFRRVQLFDYGFPIGMTRSLPGEGWYALGWLGVVIWCGLWGGCLGAIYRRFANGPQTTFQTALYFVFIPTLVVAFRDGLLLSLVKQTGVYFTPIAVWYLLARYFGLPKARDIAAILQNRQRQAQAALASPGEPVQEPVRARASRALDHLPPAARRRRIALARTSAAEPAE